MQRNQITLIDIYNEIKKIELALHKKGIIKEEGNEETFLQEIQKQKMTEIWDNKYDKIWETA